MVRPLFAYIIKTSRDTHQYECGIEPVQVEENYKSAETKLQKESVKSHQSKKETLTINTEAIENEHTATKDDNINKKESQTSKTEKMVSPKVETNPSNLHTSGNRKKEGVISSKLAELIEERKVKLSEALNHHMDQEDEKAIIKAKRVYEISKLFCQKASSGDYFQLIADGLLLVKFLSIADKITTARQLLLEVWVITQEYLKNPRIEGLRGPNTIVISNNTDQSDKTIICFVNDKSISFGKKKEIYE